MLKIAALLFNSIALLFYQLFFTDGVTITPTIPSNAQAGTEFTVELAIEKGSNSGFAKLQQDLPAGFTAVEGESSGGSFTFINQSVKIIWMALPEASTIYVSYKVKVAAGAVGSQTLSGNFAYVYDNVKQTINIPPTIINVTDGTTPPQVAVQTQATTPDTTLQTTKPAEIPPTPEPASNVSGSRKLPENILSNNEFFVEVTINKGNIGGFAKFVETLPAGFTAKEVKSDGAVFSFVDQKVTYIWASMPTQPEFKVSYKVKIDPSMDGEKLIEGLFSFAENDQIMKYVLPPSFIKVLPSAAPPAPIVKKERLPAKKVNPPKELSASNIPASQGKVHYRVQILALRKAKSVETIITYFKLNETLSLEMAEGYTKYTAGYHEEYKSAHDARDRFATQNSIAGPFVAAYNNGRRITVQEALMITNQKWYK